MRKVNRVLFVFCCLVSLSINNVSQAAPKAKMIEFWNDYEPDSGLKLNHSTWQSMLDKYLDDMHPSGVNRFNYDQVTDQDKQLLIQYLDFLQGMDPRQLNRPRKKAFWLNLYNATIVSMVLASKPEQSIKGIGSIWRKKRLVVARQKMSLDDIEHGVLRPLFNDPRIHFGLTPATIGSGDLPAEAFTGDNVEELLERNTQDFFVSGNKGAYIEGNRLVVSSIFKWYKSDFGGNDVNVKSFIKKYANEGLRASIDQSSKISYQYDWGLNKP